ncbi:MAG: hypothetical protein Q9224_003286 [Gallowayella concinna]
MARAHLIHEGTSQLVRDRLRDMRNIDNDADIIRHRLREHIDIMLNDVRHGPDVTEAMTSQELRALTASNIVNDRQSLQDDRETLRAWREGPQEIPTPQQRVDNDPNRTPRASTANLVRQPPQMGNGVTNTPAVPYLPSGQGAAAGRPQQPQLPGLPNGGPQQRHGGNGAYGNAVRGPGHPRGPRFGGYRGGLQNPRGGNPSGLAGPGNVQHGQPGPHAPQQNGGQTRGRYGQHLVPPPPAGPRRHHPSSGNQGNGNLGNSH